MEALWYRQGATAAELGKLLILDKATLSGTLDRMLESGWIRKKRDPDDGRVFRLLTTDKADAIKEDLIELRIKANDEMLETFSIEEKLLLKRMLIDLI